MNGYAISSTLHTLSFNESHMVQQNQMPYYINTKLIKLLSMTVSSKKKVNILPIKMAEAEDILCAPTVCTIPVASSFTLMLDEPKTTPPQC